MFKWVAYIEDSPWFSGFARHGDNGREIAHVHERAQLVRPHHRDQPLGHGLSGKQIGDEIEPRPARMSKHSGEPEYGDEEVVSAN